MKFTFKNRKTDKKNLSNSTPKTSQSAKHKRNPLKTIRYWLGFDSPSLKSLQDKGG